MRLPHFQKHSVSLYQTVSHRYGILLVNVESEENNLDGSNYRCRKQQIFLQIMQQCGCKIFLLCGIIAVHLNPLQ